MKISIAMATYNGAMYLQEQLDSFVAQTRLPDELVVCDDGSSDKTIEILSTFAQTAPFRVVLVSNEENLGFIKNFEKSLKLCTGDLIFLSDQDDVWWCNKLEIVDELFTNYPTKMVIINDQVITNNNLEPTSYTKLQNIRAIGLNDSYFMTGCCTAIRRSFLKIALPIEADCATHDVWIHVLAHELGVRVVHEYPLQYFRRHDTNTSDWVVSRPTKVSIMDSIRIHGLKDATEGWYSEIARLQRCISRLNDLSLELDSLGLLSEGGSAISQLRRKCFALSRRAEITSKVRWRRYPELVSFWVSGGYKYFAGWKSFLKDILR